MSNLQKKVPFMAAVFGHLIFQIFVAYRAAEATTRNMNLKTVAESNRLFLGLASLILIVFMSLVPLPIPVKVAVFSIISFLGGMSVHNIPNLQEALLEVIGIFILMFVVGVITVQMGFKLNILGNVLFFSLLAVLIARIINAFRTPSTTRARNNKAYTKILTLIFVLFVVYDTNMILQRNYGGNFVNASLDYFLDIINLLRLTANNE
jgi:FtsH-binding integral membrane protein